jgi:hypothetical protein
MKEIPTAKEFLTQQKLLDASKSENPLENLLIEFAILHVVAQNAAIKKVIEPSLENTFDVYLTDDCGLEITVNDLIDSAYPLTNIK